MLNRRILRIEVLQTTFAYLQGKNSLKQMARESLAANLGPDMDTMNNQDIRMLAVRKREALKIFDDKIDELNPRCTHTDKEIEKLVNAAFIKYENDLRKDFKFLKKRMLLDIEGTRTTYLKILQLLVEFRNVASTIKSNFGTSPQNFVKNLLIRKIEYDKSIKGAILAAGVSWTPQKEKVREWYRDIVRKDSQFEEYLKLDKTDFFVDKGLVDHLLRDIILKNQAIGAFFEEEDLRWSEHEAVVKGMIKKSMKEIEEEKEFPQFSISVDWEEDKEFFEVLFDRVIEEERNIEALIGRKVKNWELDRLALIDKIILSLAVAELKNFPNIPVKVTINEYIEVSKRYSTPKSKEFINGVLDGITQELKSQGLIKKSGRGLLDNK